MVSWYIGCPSDQINNLPHLSVTSISVAKPVRLDDLTFNAGKLMLGKLQSVGVVAPFFVWQNYKNVRYSNSLLTT